MIFQIQWVARFCLIMPDSAWKGPDFAWNCQILPEIANCPKGRLNPSRQAKTNHDDMETWKWLILLDVFFCLEIGLAQILLFWVFSFLLNSNFQNCIPEFGFAQGSFYARPLAKCFDAKFLFGKNRFSNLILLASWPFLVSSDKIQTKFRQTFRQNSDKIQTKIHTKFRHNPDTIQTKIQTKITQKFRQNFQTTKFRQNSDNKMQTNNQTTFRQNSDNFQTKFRQQNSDRIQTTKFRDKIQTKFRQISDQTSDKIQTTNFRQNSDNKNADKIQTTKFRQNSDKTQTTKFRENSDNNIQTKFRQLKNQTRNSDKIPTKFSTKFRQNSDKFRHVWIHKTL